MKCRSSVPPTPIEFFPRRFYLVIVRERTTCSMHRAKNEATNLIPTSERHLFPRTPGVQFVSLQEHLPSTSSSSENILGISQTIRFNSFLTSMLRAGPKNVHYFFLRRRHLREEIQAIHLICRWRLLYLHLPPHEALSPFEHLPYVFSSFLSSFESFDPPNILVSLTGIAKGLERELLVENERSADTKQYDMSTDLEDTISAVKRRRVSLVIAVSKMHSGISTFTEHGLEVLDISSSTTSPSDKLDRSNERLISRFLDTSEGTEGLIAVYASPGSGLMSAITCIGCFLMKHSNFTSQEAIGWLQFCLPVKISMTWVLFLKHMQSQMWLEGERFRRVRDDNLPDDITNSSTTDSMHINIGKISLGRGSLLGTRDRDKHRVDSYTANIPVGTCLSTRSHESELSPTTSTTTAQLKRRPLTQGSAGSRRYHRNSDGTSLRADFALMHKFLHQTPSSSRSTPNSTNSSPSGIHAVPSRPKASTPSSTSSCEALA
ncbi:Dual specificity protein phosphatase [Phytophthora megakarya]|uniref:Dual specificity protein phosphatase n=1 Tax=Phytophthora megakarya TaxID=4795 RepID=A0A225WYF2_9STRA|nr:Dual specificity protein phosphatase [Phytophthora megakarya]